MTNKISPETAGSCSQNNTLCSCSGTIDNKISNSGNIHFINGYQSTPAGEVPRVETKLTFKDILGTCKARWGIHRMNYKITPGLYCIGHPNCKSPVLVTGNYKMSFDCLRKELSGLNAWILVLDTKGVNVWCAAGKGTFGTEELISRISKFKLSSIVSHNTVILPQLGAPGVASNEVFKHTGFKVIFGPVRAEDVPAFIKAGMKATPEMRKVNFTLHDRLVLIPMEIVLSYKTVGLILSLFLILGLLEIVPLSFRGLVPYLGAVVVGCTVVPALLPWIPGRAFALKGWLMGIVWVISLSSGSLIFSPAINWYDVVKHILILPPISAYLSMNFTGASTYTSLSGVLKEIKIAIPIIVSSIVLGIAFSAIHTFIISHTI